MESVLPINPMPVLFTDMDGLVRFARLRAKRDIFDGRETPRAGRYLRMCSHVYSIASDISARMIYSRDSGHHSGGWWKNPDYERCYHLSISFCVNPTDAPLPFDRKEAQKIANAFFEGDTRLCWVEPPYTDRGKACGVHHYRLFCDEQWKPILPRGEVYSKQFTERGWKSFSDIHGEERERG